MRTLRAGTWKTSRSKRAGSGFTLIELMVVLFVIGLIATLVFPSFGSFELSRLKSEARRLQAATTLTYNLAVMEKANYRLAFDLDAQCWWAEKKQGPVYVPASNDLLLKHCLPESVWIEELEVMDRRLNRSGQEYVYFSPFGYSEPARIYLTNESGQVGSGYTLFIQSATGAIQVYEGRKEYHDLEQKPNP